MRREATGERGSAALELVLITPALVLLMLLAVAAGRMAQARADVDAAARDAARAASILRGSESAAEAGRAAAAMRLREGGVTCRTLRVELDTAAFRPGGSVAATVTCAVDLGDLTSLRIAASRTVSSTFAEPVDAFRAASP